MLMFAYGAGGSGDDPQNHPAREGGELRANGKRGSTPASCGQSRSPIPRSVCAKFERKAGASNPPASNFTEKPMAPAMCSSQNPTRLRGTQRAESGHRGGNRACPGRASRTGDADVPLSPDEPLFPRVKGTYGWADQEEAA